MTVTVSDARSTQRDQAVFSRGWNRIFPGLVLWWQSRCCLQMPS